MIRKISSIQHMGVFSDFKWDDSVKDSSGNVLCFKQVNVMYGRNYSGKTTLSRIIRAFETGRLSDKYENPSFILETENTTYTEANYPSKCLLVRVFNEDFVRDNLRFIVDPNETIAPFAILGEDNDRLEKQIEQIKKLLGTEEPGAETGLYQKRAVAFKEYQDAKSLYDKAKADLNKQMKEKATDRQFGIKYHSERFGNQNYTIRNLESDIEIVLSADYIRPSNEQIAIYESAIVETTMKPPKKLQVIRFSITQLSNRVKEICTRKVGQSKKIQELLTDIALQEWVYQGLAQNRDRERCAFCGSPLSDERWKELYSHFDEESEKLRKDIENCLQDISIEEMQLQAGFSASSGDFYASFASDIDLLIQQYKVFSDGYIKALGALRTFLLTRKDSLHTPIEYSFEIPNLAEYGKLISEYSNLREKNIMYSDSIDSLKKEAQKQLRLVEVHTFVKTVNYVDTIAHIKSLESAESVAQKELITVNEEIRAKILEIDNLRLQQNDEEKGAIRVNELLHLYFGHKYLSIVSKKNEDENGKHIFFEVDRNGKKAFHLSEGEKSLIAFCYFIAKLKDSETDGKNPIIWIDDPISSLDENHIYYVYSLITQEILRQDNYEQLFITTHNLLFLKYLRKLDINKHNKAEKGMPRENFLVERRGKCSTIIAMPKYLKEHGTEFNRWFENIYYCAVSDSITDENIYLYESFGNNARKFLETYLYYRYPDKGDLKEHLTRFFGNDTIPPILVLKLENESSHAQGDLENHLLPFDMPEITEAAKLIIKRLEEIDKDQFEALKSCIKQN